MQRIVQRMFAVTAICVLPHLPASALTPDSEASADFVGAQTCKACHQTQYDAWSSSHHAGSMQTADSTSVLGDFSNVTVVFHNIRSRFFEQEGEYRVETVGPDGKTHVYTIKYTFGVEPLQQYLIELDHGHVQAFNIAWDTRSIAEGGQRWFHLRPNEDISPSHLFFWSRHFQNWNSRCAECHSTRVERNYSEEGHRYDTRFSEVNVACESCHGPAREHVALIRSGQLSTGNSGFLMPTQSRLDWSFEEGKPIAVPQGDRDDRFLATCGGCHSLRTTLTEDDTGPYHENYAIQLINEPSYFADGQIREEVFVLGSFLQSKMYQAGVTCDDCHEPHSLELRRKGNQLCAQCHRPEVFDRVAHHNVTREAASPECVDCHMPTQTYMQVDDRRDHSFVVPGRGAIATRGVDSLAPILKASQLAELSSRPSPDTISSIQPNLASEDPLIRRGAAMGAAGLPPQWRWQLLGPLINDPSQLVRMEVATALLELLNQLPGESRERLRPLILEYKQYVELNRDTPTGQLALALIALQLGKPEQAEAAYQQALRIEPNFVPTLLNVADHYRATGRDQNAAGLLARAIEIAPDSAEAQHSYGLYLIRQQLYEQSLPHLRAAAHLDEGNTRYVYVLAVALENQGQADMAIDTLVKADRRLPDRYDLLYTLVLYQEKYGREDEILPYLRRLMRLAPGAPEVQRLWQKYRPR